MINVAAAIGALVAPRISEQPDAVRGMFLENVWAHRATKRPQIGSGKVGAGDWIIFARRSV